MASYLTSPPSVGASYPKQYVMTSWVDFRVKQVNIPDTSTAVELYLFDCAGQSIFNQIEANNVHYEVRLLTHRSHRPSRPVRARAA